MRIVALSNIVNIILNKIGTPDEIKLFYKLNNNTYSYDIGSQVVLNQGQSVQFYNENNNFSKDQGNYYQFSITGNVKIQNSINSLINNSDLSNYCFYSLFKGCTGINSISQNLLPTTTLTNYCYSHMFYGCTGIITTTNLPAITLVKGCYSYMFQGCSNLSNITINFKDWNNGNSTQYWLSGVSLTGTFKCSYLLLPKKGSSYIPYGWK